MNADNNNNYTQKPLQQPNLESRSNTNRRSTTSNKQQQHHQSNKIDNNKNVINNNYHTNVNTTTPTTINNTNTNTNTNTSNINNFTINNNNNSKGGPCVIGVIGDSSKGKSLFLNKMAEKAVFHDIKIEFNRHTADETVKFEIYNDVEKDNVYINLNSFQDTKLFIDLWDSIQNMTPFEIEKWLEDGEFIFLKSLLFMFHICNIIFLVFENLTIKLEYFTIFKILKHVKQMIAPSIHNLLFEKLNLPPIFSTFIIPGKSIPILQIFLLKDLNENYQRDSHLKLEESLKKQILLLLKSYGLFTTVNAYLTTISTTTTTSVPTTTTGSNVQVQTQQQIPLFLIEINRPLVRLLRLYQISSNTIQTLFNQDLNTLAFPKQYRYYSQLVTTYESNYHNIPLACINNFKTLLINSKLKLFEFKDWQFIISNLSNLFDKLSSNNSSSGSKENQQQSSTSSSSTGSTTTSPKDLNLLKKFIDTDLSFSKKICRNNIKQSMEQYQENLPISYGIKIHSSRVAKAIKTICFNSSGPALEFSIDYLRMECDQIWKRGKRLCEAESLSGRICNLKTHNIPPLPNSCMPPPPTLVLSPPPLQSLFLLSSKDSNSSSSMSSSLSSNSNSSSIIETRVHQSGYRTRATCNCGKTTSLREDIFEIEYGNLLFYQQNCCRLINSVQVSNTRVSYRPCKSYDFNHYVTPYPWFSVLDFGIISKQSTALPFNNDQSSFYILNNDQLQDWNLRKILTILNRPINQQQQQQHQQSPSSKKQNSNSSGNNNGSGEPYGKLSFEYQCPTGHRFIEKRKSRKFFVEMVVDEDDDNGGGSELIQFFFQKPMMEECKHSDCNYYSQLSRVYINSSLNELSINSCIEISQHEKQPSDKWTFQMDSFVPLLKDHLYSIRLPFVFEYQSKPIPLKSPNSCSFILNIKIKPTTTSSSSSSQSSPTSSS